jgi:hypothetical protein
MSHVWRLDNRDESRERRGPAPACPTATLHDLIPAGHSGRWNAPTPDAHRTPEAGHWTPGRSDTRTGHRTPIGWTATRGTPDARTGHRRGQGDDSTTGVRPPGASWTNDRTLDPSRVPALARPGSCWVAPLARPRLGALLSSVDFGSSVERRGGSHPVYGEEGRCLCVLVSRACVGGMGSVRDKRSDMTSIASRTVAHAYAKLATGLP